MIRWLFLLLIAGLAHGQSCFIKDPATADSLGASATVVNATLPALTILTSAYDPVADAIVGPGVRRQRNQTIGTTVYAMDLIEGGRTCLLAAGTSGRFDQWTAVAGGTVTADTTAAPNGEVTAQTLTDPGASLSGVSQSETVANDSLPFVYSMYVLKTAGGTAPTFGVTLALTGGTPVTVNARINTDNGTQQYGSNANVSIVNADATYWRVIVLIANNTSGNVTLTESIYPAAAAYGASVDDATATGTAICTFADLNKAPGGSTTYFAASPHSYRNLILQSQVLNTTWTKTRITITTDSTANPVDGGVNADTIVEDATAANTHVLSQSITKSAAASQTFTFSTYLLQSGRTWALVECNSTVSSALGAGMYFNLATGAKGTAVTTAGWTLTSSNITAVGSWYRCDITVVSDTNAVIIPQIYTATGDVLAIHNGNSAAALICWGNQLVYGLKPQNYWATTTAGTRAGANFTCTMTSPTDVGTIISVNKPYGWGTDQDGGTAYKWFSSSTPNALEIRRNSSVSTTLEFARSDGAGTNISSQTWTPTNGVNATLGLSWNATSVIGYVNGVQASVVGTPTTPPYTASATLKPGQNAASNAVSYGWALGFQFTTALPPSSQQIFANGVVP